MVTAKAVPTPKLQKAGKGELSLMFSGALGWQYAPPPSSQVNEDVCRLNSELRQAHAGEEHEVCTPNPQSRASATCHGRENGT